MPAGQLPQASGLRTCCSFVIIVDYIARCMTCCMIADVVVAWGLIGRLKPEDVPPAAVDFHISSILEGLLSDANILAAARVAAAKVGSEPAGALKSAMWHFSGSCNHRSLLQV